MAIRKKHTPKLKVKVVLEALKGRVTVAEIASDNWVSPAQVSSWKKDALRIMEDGFAGPKGLKKLHQKGSRWMSY